MGLLKDAWKFAVCVAKEPKSTANTIFAAKCSAVGVGVGAAFALATGLGAAVILPPVVGIAIALPVIKAGHGTWVELKNRLKPL